MAAVKSWSQARESLELIPVTLAHNGTAQTSGVQILFTTRTERPDEDDPGWKDASVVEGATYALVGPGGDHELDPDTWTVWTRKTASPERPVMAAGTVSIT